MDWHGFARRNPLNPKKSIRSIRALICCQVRSICVLIRCQWPTWYTTP